MIVFGDNNFGVLDWIVVGGTLLISLLIGIYYAVRGKHSNEDLLVGGRKMRIFPVAASIMVTYVSAITVLGFPAEVYSYGGQIFMIHVMSAVAFPLSAFIFIPFFYRMKLTSVNQYLEERFESKWVRWLSSGTFILQQVLLSGVVLYAPSIALEAFLGLPVWISIVLIGICGTVYTTIGGIKAVVITDTFQFLMMVAGMVAIVVKSVTSSGGVLQVYKIAKDGGRLDFIDLTFDPFMRHNLWNFVIGSGFYALMQPAVHQLQVQRFSSMPNVSSARKAIICSVPLKLIVMSMCLLTGVSIYAIYVNCDPVKNGMIRKGDQIVPYFVKEELASIPGMIGLFTACIFSAVLSSVSSSLNSLSAVTWEDFLFRLKYFKALSPKGQANVSRFVGLVYGLICMGVAFGAQNVGTIYSATFGVVGATGGAIFGVFLLGMFVPFANAFGAIVGMLTGLISMLGISIVAYLTRMTPTPLPSSVDQCFNHNHTSLSPLYNLDNETLFLDTSTVTPFGLIDPAFTGEWPGKVVTISYLLYAVVGAGITISVGILFSIFHICVNGGCGGRKVRKEYLHPIVQWMCGCCYAKEYQEDVFLSTGSIIRVDPLRFKTPPNKIPVSSYSVNSTVARPPPNNNNYTFPYDDNGKLNMGFISTEL